MPANFDPKTDDGLDGGRPDVSIIMSVYNESRWLPSTVDAVLAQTCRSFEFLIIDDASTDDTAAILAKYNDRRIRVLRHTSRNGWMNNINKLAELSRGKLLKLQCPDDVMLPTCLERATQFFDLHQDIGYFFTDYTIVDELGRSKSFVSPHLPKPIINGRDADFLALTLGCFARTSCLFVPRLKWHELGGMRDVTTNNTNKLPIDEDWDLMVRLQELSPVGEVNEKLVLIRDHASQTHRSKDARRLNVEAQCKILLLVAERLQQGELIAGARVVERQLLRQVVNAVVAPAIRSVLAGDFGSAWIAAKELHKEFSVARLLTYWVAWVVAPFLRVRLGRLIPAVVRTK